MANAGPDKFSWSNRGTSTQQSREPESSVLQGAEEDKVWGVGIGDNLATLKKKQHNGFHPAPSLTVASTFNWILMAMTSITMC